MKQTIVLAIMDGWGIGKEDESNPIYVSKLPSIEYAEQNYPAGALKSSGLSVGLPWGEAGNSEVGHLTLGAGRVLYQHYLRIKNSIEDGSFFKNKALKGAFDHAKTNASSVHLVGLLTKGYVHAALDHLEALIEMAKKEEVDNLYLHLFTDGRDSPPESAKELIEKVEKKINESGVGKITSIAGRYYGLDRDQNWQLTERTYKMLRGEAPEKSIDDALNAAYEKDLSDEYVEPAIIEKHPINPDDSIIFFDFREDRMKQISRCFIDPNFNKFQTENFENLYVATMTQYHDDLQTPIAFPKEKVSNTLGEVIANNGKTQLRVAETQKYAHITYFFNGLREDPYNNEFRVLIPSENIDHYDRQPKMRAKAITDRAVVSLRNNEFDFILINFANPDIIAHTGNYRATIEAVKFVDQQIGRLANTALSNNHILLITSDHGNAEAIMDLKTGQPQTEHEANPVPFYLIGNDFKINQPSNNGRLPKIGMLSDVAPTILDIMNIPQPQEMTGNSLLDII